MATALVIGATGLIGKQLVDLLQADAYYAKVITVTRQPAPVSGKIENVPVHFDKLNDVAEKCKADHIFCCLGTTIKQVKTKEAFRKVDFEYPLTMAKIAKQNGASHFLLVSALGADKQSPIFYNRVKGEVEEAIDKIGFLSYHIFRPSLLLGSRTEKRAGEGMATWVFQKFHFLIPKKYKAIDSIKVAKAMVHAARQSQGGTFIHESTAMQIF